MCIQYNFVLQDVRVAVAMDRGNRALAEMVKRRREAFELSQEDVAEKVGMSLRSYQYLEAGETKK